MDAPFASVIAVSKLPPYERPPTSQTQTIPVLARALERGNDATFQKYLHTIRPPVVLAHSVRVVHHIPRNWSLLPYLDPKH